MDINAYLEGFRAGYELAERERAKLSLDKYLKPTQVPGSLPPLSLTPAEVMELAGNGKGRKAPRV